MFANNKNIFFRWVELPIKGSPLKYRAQSGATTRKKCSFRGTYKEEAEHNRSLLKRIVYQFWIYNIFSCLNKRYIFYKMFITIKQLWLKITEKKRCSKSFRLSTVIYIIFITRTDFEHHFSQLFRVRIVLSRRETNKARTLVS